MDLNSSRNLEYPVVIIDYGAGNLGSVANMILKIGIKPVITSDLSIIRKANKIILPGVGSYDNAVKKLQISGLFDEIKYNVINLKKPILGICLGMQLLGKSSSEGKLSGFGFFDYNCQSFSNLNFDFQLKVPNMGWREVTIQKNSKLSNKIQENDRFYFVHSYYVPINEIYTTLSTHYGISYTAAISYENIYGTQFHPEKSHRYGMQILKNFLKDY
jgi:glutamine amidotransferase